MWTLTVPDGTHTAALTLFGQFTAVSFQDLSGGGSGKLAAFASTTNLSAILAVALMTYPLKDCGCARGHLRLR